MSRDTKGRFAEGHSAFNDEPNSGSFEEGNEVKPSIPRKTGVKL